jgi:hypothetical protein
MKTGLEFNEGLKVKKRGGGGERERKRTRTIDRSSIYYSIISK